MVEVNPILEGGEELFHRKREVHVMFVVHDDVGEFVRVVTLVLVFAAKVNQTVFHTLDHVSVER